MYNNLLLRARGFCSTRRFFIIEDSLDSYVILNQSNDQHSYFIPYCREYEVDQLMKALEETSLVNWRGDLLFGDIQTFLVNPIQALAQKMGVSLTEDRYYRFTYHPHLDTESLRIKPATHSVWVAHFNAAENY
ncbi:uncharacterized protein LOC121868982 isoform X2 [Homarus americanus]|nr:uncharacterized protein LOC121868982 isoform X2 [Homarus americanus]